MLNSSIVDLVLAVMSNIHTHTHTQAGTAIDIVIDTDTTQTHIHNNQCCDIIEIVVLLYYF